MGYNNGYDDGEWFGQKEGYRKGYKAAKAKFGRPDEEVRKEAYDAATRDAYNGEVVIYDSNAGEAIVHTSLGGETVTGTVDDGFGGTPSVKELKLPLAKNFMTSSFSYNEYLTGVYLPKIEVFDRYCLQGCKALSTIDVGDNLAEVGDSAFQDVPYALQSLSWANLGKLRKVGIQAFAIYSGEGDGDATGYTFSAPNLEIVGDRAFETRSSMTEAVMPRVTSIGEGVFFDCGSLYRVDLSSLVLTTDSYVNSMFYGCSSLTEIRFDSSDESVVLALAGDMDIPSGCTIYCKRTGTGQVGPFIYNAN